MAVAIALLRGVNVGGRTVRMVELTALARDLDLQNPRTLLQSGNLVFEAPRAPDASLEARLETALKSRFGFAVDVICRSAVEWARLVAANPFPDAARNDPAHLLAMPLKTAPVDGGLERLRAAIKGREEAALIGRDLYVVYPDTIGRSKLTMNVVERQLGAPTTGRNWNTVLKLAEMIS